MSQMIRIAFDILATRLDHRRRMYTSNALAKIVEKLEENLHEVHNMIEADHDDADIDQWDCDHDDDDDTCRKQ